MERLKMDFAGVAAGSKMFVGELARAVREKRIRKVPSNTLPPVAI
jgi:hypothetical protein